MIDLSHIIHAATQFVNTHPSHPRFPHNQSEEGQPPHLNTDRSDQMRDRASQYAHQAADLPQVKGWQRPTDTEIAIALLPALLGQNPKYLGSLISGYHHGMGEELARQHANRRDQQASLLNLARHYSDAAHGAHTDELSQFSQENQNYRTGVSNRRMADVAETNAKRIAKHASNGRLTPEQTDALHQFNQNMSGIADGPEGWTADHQSAYMKALSHLRSLPIFADNPGVIDSLVKSYPVGYKSATAVTLAHDTYHKFLSSIYHPGLVTEGDVRRAHNWLIKNVPESSRWQFIAPQEGESWQTTSHRLAQAEATRQRKASGGAAAPSRGSGEVAPVDPRFDGKDWTGNGPIGSVKPGTLPRARAAGKKFRTPSGNSYR